MNAITVRIPHELKSDLQQISESTDQPVSDLVRESLRRYVAVERFRQLRKKT
ncbi:MAG: ribbon-helix-helix protein, CopG family, partial [Chlorobi bacterium]|nr:ribbon-helix-helix protein, CopG family [Chlorobiota bacterium]